MKNKDKSRYLVILDEYGMIEDIIYDATKILKYIQNELDSETSKRGDKKDS